MDEKELQKLFGAVSSKFDIGSFDTFKEKMSTPEQRKSFYDVVNKHGFDIGDYNAYETRLAGVSDKKKAEPTTQSPTPEQQQPATTDAAQANGVGFNFVTGQQSGLQVSGSGSQEGQQSQSQSVPTDQPQANPIDFNKKDPIGEAIFPLEFERNQLVARNVSSDNTGRKSILIDAFTKDGRAVRPSETPVAELNNKIDAIKSSVFTTNDEAKAFIADKLAAKNIQLPAQNRSLTSPEKETVDQNNIDQFSVDDLRANIDPNNLTQKIAFDKYQKDRNIGDALKGSGTMQEAAIKYAASQNKQLATQIDALGGATDALPNAFAGQLVANFIYSPDLIAKIKDNPDQVNQWKQAEANLYTDYPDYAKWKVSQIISQERENRNMNGVLANAPTQGSTDDLVKQLVAEGKLQAKDVPIYQDMIRPYLGITNSIGRGIGRLVAPALVNESPITTTGLAESFEDSYVNTLRGAARSIEDISQNLSPSGAPVSDNQQRLHDIVQHQYSAVSVDPKGAWNNLSAAGGQVMGFLAPMILGGEIAKAGGLTTEGGQLLTNAVMFEGPNKDQAIAQFPDNPDKQFLYTTLATGGDVALGKLLPTKEAADAARKLMRPELTAIIDAYADKTITATEAKQQLGEKILQWAGTSVAKNAELGSVMTGFNVFHNTVDAAFGGRDVSTDQAASEALNTFKTGFLGGTALSAIGAYADAKQNNVRRQVITEMANNADYFRKIIEDDAKLDPNLAATANERIANLNVAAKIKTELDQTNLNKDQKGDYLLTALQQNIWERRAENTSDNVLKKQYENKAKELSARKEAIFNSGEGQGNAPVNAPEKITARASAIKTANETFKQNISEIDKRDDIPEDQKDQLKAEETIRHSQSIQDIASNTEQKPVAPAETKTAATPLPEQVIKDAADNGTFNGPDAESLRNGDMTPGDALFQLAKQKYGVSDDGSDVGTPRNLTGFNTDVLDAVDKKYPDKQSVVDQAREKYQPAAAEFAIGDKVQNPDGKKFDVVENQPLLVKDETGAVQQLPPDGLTKVEPTNEEPTKEQQLRDVQQGKTVTFTYNNESEVPDVFKDKISSKGEINGKKTIRVTVPQSLADYELGKTETQKPAENIPQKTEENIPAETQAFSKGAPVEVKGSKFNWEVVKDNGDGSVTVRRPDTDFEMVHAKEDLTLKGEPAKAEPVKTEPVKAAEPPAKVEPVKQEPSTGEKKIGDRVTGTSNGQEVTGKITGVASNSKGERVFKVKDDNTGKERFLLEKDVRGPKRESALMAQKPEEKKTVEKKAAPKAKMIQKADVDNNPVYEVEIGGKKFNIQRIEGIDTASTGWNEVIPNIERKGDWVGPKGPRDVGLDMSGFLGYTKAEAIDTLVKRHGDETAIEKANTAAITSEEFDKFQATKEAPPHVIENLAAKVAAGDEPLNDQEKEVLADKAVEVTNQLEADGTIPKDVPSPAEILEPDFADRLFNVGTAIKKFDITGSGGGAAMTNLFKIPQELLGNTVQLIALTLKAGKVTGETLADAIKKGVDYLKSKGYKDVDADGELTDYVKDVMAGKTPQLKVTAEAALQGQKDLMPEDDVVEVAIKEKKQPFRNYAVSNLNLTKAESQEAKNAAVKMGAGKSQLNIIIRSAVPKIEKLLGKGGFEQLAKAVVQSRLNGIRERWYNLSNAVKSIADADVLTQYKGGLKNLIDAYDRHYPEMTAKEATQAALARGDLKGFKALTEIYFEDAALKVQDVDFGDSSYAEVVSHPNWDKALQIYKDKIEKPISDIHSEHEGFFSDALGDLKTYYPMVPMVQEGHIFMKKGKIYGTSVYTNNFFASGLSPKGYDTSLGAFATKMKKFINTSNKDGLMKTLEEAGLIKITHRSVDQGLTGESMYGQQLTAPYITINGEPMRARVIEISPAREVVGNDGSVTRIPSQNALVPDWLHKELKPFLEEQEFDSKSAHKILDWTTNFALGSPFEFSLHGANLFAALQTGTPYADTTLLGKIASVNMIPKFLYTVSTIWSEKLPEEDILRMSQEGLISNRYGSVTSKRADKDLVEAAGGHFYPWYNLPKQFTVGLFGKTGLDIKVRHRMWRLHQDMFPDNTAEQVSSKRTDVTDKQAQIKQLKESGAPKADISRATGELETLQKDLSAIKKDQANRIEDRRNFVNQTGNYVWAAQGSIERYLKKTGLTPFYTAGSTMWRNGIDAWLSTGPLTTKSPGKIFGKELTPMQAALSFKIAQNFSSGLIGMVGTWAALYYAVTGKTPDKDKNARLFEIPVPESWKKSEFVKTIFYHGGEWGNMGMGFVNPLMVRGARALGIRGGYNALKAGGTIGQAVEHGYIDAFNSAISPVTSSPILNVGATALTGSSFYIHSMRDTYGSPGVQTYKTVKRYPAGTQQLANFGQAAINLNPFMTKVVDYFGYSMEPVFKNEEHDTKTQKVLSAIIGMVAPRFLTPPHNTAREERNMIKEEKLTEKKDR